MKLDTGWHPTNEQYHALALEGVVSSSMLNDLVPPWGRPRVYKAYYVDQTVAKPLVGVDAWRGTIVDLVLTEGGRIGWLEQLQCRGVATADGRVIGVIPPKFDMRKNVDKERWANWKAACEREGVGLIGLSTGAGGKEKRELAAANDLLDEVEAIADFIDAGKTPAAELARALLMGDNGVSQLSHRFKHSILECRWRPDRLVQDHAQLFTKPFIALFADHAHVSLKTTQFAHPGPFWNHYTGDGWGMRDAFYELGWSHLIDDPDNSPEQFYSGFPWHPEATEHQVELAHEAAISVDALKQWRYHEDLEPLDWIVVAAHHRPTPEVYVHVVPENQRRLGRKRCSEALQLLKHCLDTWDWTLPEERGAQLGRDPRGWEWSP